MTKEYIEREALLCMVQPDDPGDETAAITIATAKKLVRSLAHRCPAADVVPVVHAKWDANGNCGRHAPFYCMTSTYHKTPYCFGCGAKMDKEEV